MINQFAQRTHYISCSADFTCKVELERFKMGEISWILQKFSSCEIKGHRFYLSPTSIRCTYSHSRLIQNLAAPLAQVSLHSANVQQQTPWQSIQGHPINKRKGLTDKLLIQSQKSQGVSGGFPHSL